MKQLIVLLALIVVGALCICSQNPTNPQSAPAIVTQPLAQTVGPGDSATFAVVANGSPGPTYQWQINDSNITGATGSSYILPAALSSDSGVKIRCIVRNAAGIDTSTTVMLTVVNISDTLIAFYITNQVPGWTPGQFNAYQTFSDGPGLENIIDGGAGIYENDSVISGFFQKLTWGDSTSSHSFNGCVMDFGTLAKAKKIFDDVVANRSAVDTLPGYDTSIVCYAPIAGGITVFAHFETFFFQISVSGYADKPSALTDAGKFIDFYQAQAH